MRLLPVSAMNILPRESVATQLGLFKPARVARPPSPLKLAAPLPATEEIVPLDTSLMRLLPAEERYGGVSAMLAALA
jgi:hypothetical protein